jgi:integrase
MRAVSNSFSLADGLPPLPASVTTKDGAVFDPRPDEWFTWSLHHGARTVRFNGFRSLTATFRHKLKLAFVHYLERKSYGYFYHIFYRFLGFYRDELSALLTFCDQITLAYLLNYRAKQSAATEWKLGVLRTFFLEMEALGYGVCSIEAAQFLRDSTIKGAIRGTSIRTRDPEAGAFSDSELLSIQSALNGAYADGDIDLPTYAMAWLFLAYGARPIQIAALKEKDLLVSADAKSNHFYALRIPRAKEQGGRTRDTFKIRSCSKQVGRLLELLIESNRTLKADPEIANGEWPLFIGDSKGDLPGLLYHMSSRQLGVQLKKTLDRITGLKTNAKRFRITVAQRAVDDGKDKYTVAELLDHSDTTNVGVYFEASPAMVERLDRHLAMELAPLAQAFAGVLVLSEANACRGDDLKSRIYDKTLRNNVDRPLGTCGQMSFCGLNAPFACYTCRHFQPWLEAPHEEFMLALIEDRDRMIAEGYAPKIYNIKNRTILAVAEVVQLCAAERESSARGEA